MKRLWLLEYSGNGVPAPEFWPALDESEIVVSDQFFAVVEAEYDELSARCNGFPYIRIAGQPTAGKYIGEGGDETYIDDNAHVVDWAEEVVASLGIQYDDDADDVLTRLDRVF